ncbi:isochorismatase family protein [Paenarthrobacter sp. YJN-5]|nr:isochorismatase family protein [Paenarthrobacter sp. YJN-5]
MAGIVTPLYGALLGDHFSETPDMVDSWPPHCRARTKGAEIHEDLDPEFIQAYFRKGQYTAAYSGFEGVLAPEDDVPSGDLKAGQAVTEVLDEDAIGLDDWLQSHDVEDVVVVGLATDYCVRATALDAVQAGYNTTVIAELTAGIAEDPEEVFEELEAAGVEVERP